MRISHADVSGRSIITFVAAVVCLCAALTSAADAAYLQLKATLAQHLIERAWSKTLQNDGRPQRPWPWADTTPVARLQLIQTGMDITVLAGSSGTTLAFGPGMVSGSALPGRPGATVIGAHRDTHFKNLQRVKVGHTVRIQDKYQVWHEYRITGIRIADTRTDKIVDPGDGARLLLITCFPFNALLPGGPLRYVLEAELMALT